MLAQQLSRFVLKALEGKSEPKLGRSVKVKLS